jgi:hypothetical protein
MDSLYTVILCGMPEAFASRRSQLEDAFREQINRQFGSEERAAGALQTYISCDLVSRGLSWPKAVDSAMQQLGPYLPPGAVFVCDLNWSAIQLQQG